MVGTCGNIIVGNESVVTKSFHEFNIIIVGNLAKKISIREQFGERYVDLVANQNETNDIIKGRSKEIVERERER